MDNEPQGTEELSLDSEDDINLEDEEMNESTEKVYELVMEYDSHVGYRDNYQNKDVMTTPPNTEPR